MKHILDDGSKIFIAMRDENGKIVQDERTNEITKVELPEELRYAYFESRALAAKEEYKKLRAAEYPDFRDYLDAIVKGDNEQLQAYIDACQAVKTKYPKPE